MHLNADDEDMIRPDFFLSRRGPSHQHSSLRHVGPTPHAVDRLWLLRSGRSHTPRLKARCRCRSERLWLLPNCQLGAPVAPQLGAPVAAPSPALQAPWWSVSSACGCSSSAPVAAGPGRWRTRAAQLAIANYNTHIVFQELEPELQVAGNIDLLAPGLYNKPRGINFGPKLSETWHPPTHSQLTPTRSQETVSPILPNYRAKAPFKAYNPNK